MARLLLKNFGPIKSGFSSESGDDFMNISKVTIFVGNQGSGKSTVAKVFSTLTWLEKALNRGDEDISKFHFARLEVLFDYQRIKNYFKPDTIIEYIGDRYTITCKGNADDPTLNIKLNDSKPYSVPQIMYVPAERNFLTVIERANDVKHLPSPLFDFAQEFSNAQRSFAKKNVPLPINNVSYRYEDSIDASFLVGEDYEVNLLEASSGFQSVTPLFIVSKFLTEELNRVTTDPRQKLNVNQAVRFSDEFSKVAFDQDLNIQERDKIMKDIIAKYLNVCFVNIVEEPEQNLFPSSQWEILKQLLEFNNSREMNQLVITTHSPYIINYLSLVIQGNHLANAISKKKANTLFDKLYNIVPMGALVRPEDLAIYQFNDTNGTIELLPDFEGIPSDSNYLNKKLQEGNEIFDALLEIEEELSS